MSNRLLRLSANSRVIACSRDPVLACGTQITGFPMSTFSRRIEKAIMRFEEFASFSDFEGFNRNQNKDFRTTLSAPAEERKRLGNSADLSTLKAVQRFSSG